MTSAEKGARLKAYAKRDLFRNRIPPLSTTTSNLELLASPEMVEGGPEKGRKTVYVLGDACMSRKCRD